MIRTQSVSEVKPMRIVLFNTAVIAGAVWMGTAPVNAASPLMSTIGNASIQVAPGERVGYRRYYRRYGYPLPYAYYTPPYGYYVPPPAYAYPPNIDYAGPPPAESDDALLYVNRSQSLVGDTAFMRAMIPHHSIAIMAVLGINAANLTVEVAGDGRRGHRLRADAPTSS